MQPNEDARQPTPLPAVPAVRGWRARLRALDTWLSRKLFQLLWFEEK